MHQSLFQYRGSVPVLLEQVERMVDVGCGLGGSSRHLAAKYGCTAQGITLSEFQAKRGNEISREQGLG